MKTFKKFAAQGELRFVRLPDNYQIPKGATKVEPENGRVIIGHSETGHHHVMDDDCVTLYKLPDDILKCLLIVDQPDELEHLRSFDTHEPIRFETGKYHVVTGREHTPQGWRRTAD